MCVQSFKNDYCAIYFSFSSRQFHWQYTHSMKITGYWVLYTSSSKLCTVYTETAIGTTNYSLASKLKILPKGKCWITGNFPSTWKGRGLLLKFVKWNTWNPPNISYQICIKFLNTIQSKELPRACLMSTTSELVHPTKQLTLSLSLYIPHTTKENHNLSSWQISHLAQCHHMHAHNKKAWPQIRDDLSHPSLAMFLVSICTVTGNTNYS